MFLKQRSQRKERKRRNYGKLTLAPPLIQMIRLLANNLILHRMLSTRQTKVPPKKKPLGLIMKAPTHVYNLLPTRYYSKLSFALEICYLDSFFFIIYLFVFSLFFSGTCLNDPRNI
jgi:hypothetical protein